MITRGYKFRFLRLSALMAVLLVLVVPMMTTHAESELLVDFQKNEPSVTLSEAGERIFDIGYEFGVNFDIKAAGLDVVLTLDRSNSMLRIDPDTGLPVADAVWGAVNDFVTEYFTEYPESNIAIVSFGTNANKSDNWKYYDDLEETLEEIEEVYEYRDLYVNYSSNFRAYWNNGYRYAWENWQITDGATNIAKAFDYSARTVEMKEIVTKENSQDVIILFTDGVATQGGSKSQKNFNYPTSDNTNTIAAYEAGLAAQEVAEIITVGYFEGIEIQATQDLARSTLKRSQNAGFFEAAGTNELTAIFSNIVEDLNYIGTDAFVTEVVEDEFDVVEGSITPEDYTISTDELGRTVIKWPLGNVIETDYAFGYQVQVKDHVYPTGSGTIKIPINLDAELSYTDLNGEAVIEYLGRSETTIPPLSNQPLVEVDVTYEGDQYGYLVGDEILIHHDMHFINVVPFDYVSIDVNDLDKTISGGSFDTDLVLSSVMTEWAVSGSVLRDDINEVTTVTGTENLEWYGESHLLLVATQPGTYDLGYAIDYQLTNSAGLLFDFANNGSDPENVEVKEGQLLLTLTDDYGDPITDITAYADGELLVDTYDEVNQRIVVTGIVSGAHNVTFMVPSGYVFNPASTGVVLVDDDIAFTDTWSFDNPVISRTVSFYKLDIKNIAVTDRLGNSVAKIDEIDETTEALVLFTLDEPLVQVGLRLHDDYEPSDHVFTLELSGGTSLVIGPDGNQVTGFTMVGNVLSYSGSALPVGEYVAYGTINPPPSLGDDLDYDYVVDVNQLTTKRSGESASTNDVTSESLYIGLEDNEGPVITPTINEAETNINRAVYDINITDKIKITSYIVYPTVVTMDEMAIQTEVVELDDELIIDQGNIIDFGTEFPLTIELVDDMLQATGSITIYAVDAFGNESILPIELENVDLNDLLDRDVR